MYVPAESFSANSRQGLFTHYKRQGRRDDGESGKLDEELSRMSAIADAAAAGCYGIVHRILCRD